MSKVHERVYFRLLKMPCCGQLLCNLTRLPNYCPECGTRVIGKPVYEAVVHSDDNAMLTYEFND